MCTDLKAEHAIRNKAIESCENIKLFDNNTAAVDEVADNAVVSSNAWFT